MRPGRPAALLDKISAGWPTRFTWARRHGTLGWLLLSPAGRQGVATVLLAASLLAGSRGRDG
jgi:hypothetical protein